MVISVTFAMLIALPETLCYDSDCKTSASSLAGQGGDSDAQAGCGIVRQDRRSRGGLSGAADSSTGGRRSRQGSSGSRAGHPTPRGGAAGVQFSALACAEPLSVAARHMHTMCRCAVIVAAWMFQEIYERQTIPECWTTMCRGRSSGTSRHCHRPCCNSAPASSCSLCPVWSWCGDACIHPHHCNS